MKNPFSSQPQTTPKDFFLWVGVVVTLYVSAISLLILWFEYINRLIPDQLDTYVDPYSGAIRFAIASLIVIFPLYIFLTRLVNKDIRKHQEKEDYKVRKWLLFLTLFVAGVTLIIDLITLINTYLGGELTSQFILKVVSVFVVIGGAFLYYVYDLKGYWRENERHAIIAGSIVSAIVLVSVIAGFFIMGSPQTQREIRFDQERVRDLSSIQWQIVEYWQNRGELPQELTVLEDSISGFNIPQDPQTDQPYTYTVVGEQAFELCATFNQPSPNRSAIETPRPVAPVLREESNWEHDAGEVCFEREIDPERYPVRD